MSSWKNWSNSSLWKCTVFKFYNYFGNLATLSPLPMVPLSEWVDLTLHDHSWLLEEIEIWPKVSLSMGWANTYDMCSLAQKNSGISQIFLWENWTKTQGHKFLIGKLTLRYIMELRYINDNIGLYKPTNFWYWINMKCSLSLLH